MLAIDDGDLTAALQRVAKALPLARQRIFLNSLATDVFERLRRFVAELPHLSVGYSVKTNPRAELLEEARRCGFYAETISGGEVEHSITAGFAPDRIVYNGPNPATRLRIAPKYVFADSVESFAANAAALHESIAGIRLRPSRIPSHFGVPTDRLDDFIAAVRASGRSEIAVSFQVRSEDYGLYSFRDIVAGTVETAQRIEHDTGVRVVAFDAGGGHAPQGFDSLAEGDDFTFMCSYASERLHHIREFLIEPGQELDLSLEAMIAPVLDTRRTAEGPEIVIDAGHPDFPYLHRAPHRFLLLRDGQVDKLRGGGSRIIGRSCLEDDIVAQGVQLPADVGTRDAIIIADLGAYDASTQYAFATGAISGNTAP